MNAKATRMKAPNGVKERPIFNVIRKPLAPPGHPMTQAKPDEKARPAGRKAKHKRRAEELDADDEG